jgi:putative ABC transport system substrate-binding protein
VGGELTPKRLELVSELVPHVKVIALLVNPNMAGIERLIVDMQEAARAKELQLPVLKAATEDEFESAFTSLAQLHAGALLVNADVFFNTRRAQLAELAARHTVPAIYFGRGYVEAGGLISYAPSTEAESRQAGIYTGRILKGAKPADLPVQQPTTFELVVNLKTAKDLGLTIPPANPRPRRRGYRVIRLVRLLAGILVAGFAAHGVAAQVSGVPHVGLLHWASPEMGRLSAGEFREGMRSLGWIEGSTISIEDRFADGNAAQLAAQAAEFVAAKVDVIVAIDSVPARAARQATSEIPIVMTSGDPIGWGLIASLARPGGNVTGLSTMSPDLVAKQLQTLKEAVPGVSKIGVLLQQDSPGHAQLLTELERAAPNLGVSLLPVVVGTDRDLPRLFDEMTAAGADAYFVLSEPRTDAMRGEIAALGLRHRLPGAAQSLRYVDPAFVDPGLLVFYGVDFSAFHRRLALFVDKILKGARPADLPVEQPVKLQLVVNLKTATALGLTIPPAILGLADEVIE